MKCFECGNELFFYSSKINGRGWLCSECGYDLCIASTVPIIHEPEPKDSEEMK